MNAMEILAKVITRLLTEDGWSASFHKDIVYIHQGRKEYFKIKVTLEDNK